MDKTIFAAFSIPENPNLPAGRKEPSEFEIVSV
jgi:hypothetical protein